MTEAKFYRDFPVILELFSQLKQGVRISILDENQNIICLADYLAEIQDYIINNHLYEKAKELILYKDLLQKVYDYCQTDKAAPEAKQMAKECDFIGCCAVLEVLEQWLNDKGQNNNTPDIPNILTTERARKYFDKAEKMGYLERTSTGYKSKFKTKALLAYFLELVFCRGDNNKYNGQNFPDTALSELFQKKRLGRARGQIYDSKNGKPRGCEIVDEMFN